jgi:hypothetical protein
MLPEHYFYTKPQVFLFRQFSHNRAWIVKDNNSQSRQNGEYYPTKLTLKQEVY